MFKSAIAAIILVGAAIGMAAPANAVIVNYNLTFGDPDGAGSAVGGTGVLSLNLAAPLGNASGYVSLFPGSTTGSGTLAASSFVSLSATVNGLSYLFTAIGNNANQIASLGFNNGLLANINTAGAGGLATGNSSSHLQIFSVSSGGNDYQISYYPGTGFNGSGSMTASAGVVAAVPEASTWIMMILGFCGLGLLAGRRKIAARIAATA